MRRISICIVFSVLFLCMKILIKQYDKSPNREVALSDIKDRPADFIKLVSTGDPVYFLLLMFCVRLVPVIYSSIFNIPAVSA